jgi:hypothetical protein
MESGTANRVTYMSEHSCIGLLSVDPSHNLVRCYGLSGPTGLRADLRNRRKAAQFFAHPESGTGRMYMILHMPGYQEARMYYYLAHEQEKQEFVQKVRETYAHLDEQRLKDIAGGEHYPLLFPDIALANAFEQDKIMDKVKQVDKFFLLGRFKYMLVSDLHNKRPWTCFPVPMEKIVAHSMKMRKEENAVKLEKLFARATGNITSAVNNLPNFPNTIYHGMEKLPVLFHDGFQMWTSLADRLLKRSAILMKSLYTAKEKKEE